MYAGGEGSGMELHYTKLASEFFFFCQTLKHPNNHIKLLDDEE